jgi:hypothetical protein
MTSTNTSSTHRKKGVGVMEGEGWRSEEEKGAVA